MFLNREEAGERLAHKLSKIKLDNGLIIAIPRGGVVVGKIISQILNLPFSVLIVKKIASADNPELALGATGVDGIVFWDENLIESLNVSNKDKEAALKTTLQAVKKRAKSLGISLPKVKNKTSIVVDD